MKYAALVKAIHSATAQLQGRAAMAVNQALVLRNWLVGSWILEFEQHGQDRAKYGERLLESLAKDLSITGLEIRNLQNCRLLYAAYGRSPAFRRKILAIYDHQCAACGLRIKLPAGNDVSFIDAAHLIPFSESQNDHPSNGLALCKNHHWAMDRNLIAPCPDHHWHVSSILDARRSNGEKELLELTGKSVLMPKDPAFYPDEEGLEWRHRRLIA